MKRFISTVFIACLTIASYAQLPDVLNSRYTSYYTYIYRVSDIQIHRLAKKGIASVDETFFSDLVTFYPTDSLRTADLSHGVYIEVRAQKDNLQLEVLTISDIEVDILNNNSDLQLLLRQKNGSVINDAQVILDRRKIKYDGHTETYRHKGSNLNGLLQVIYEGKKVYFLIERDENNPKALRALRKIIYSVPLKYLTIPVQLILRSPIDLVKTATHPLRPSGIFYYISKPPRDIVRSIRYGYPEGVIGKIYCFFDRSFCGKEKVVEGYFILNKPIFKPGDTIRWKAFLVKPNGRPYKKDLNLWISRDTWQNDERKLVKGDIQSQNGAYFSELVLSDSLNLKLDSDYKLFLTHGTYNTIINHPFHYEIYELKGMELEVSSEKEKHHPGQSQKIIVTGKDVNGLNLLDAAVNLTIKIDHVDTVFKKAIFVPDTLWNYRGKLDPLNETEILLPDSIFPQANFSYTAIVKLTSSDNEIVEKSIGLNYAHRSIEFRGDLEGDSIVFYFEENGISQEQNGLILALDNNKNTIGEYQVSFPHRLKINPHVTSYKCVSVATATLIQMSDWQPLIELRSSRNFDSLKLQLSNPHRLPINYNVYRKNKGIVRGRSSDLALSLENTTKKNYFASIQYFWAGQKVEENYAFSLPAKQLNIRVFQPETISPGQKQEISILVSDKKNRPVENVDVAAFSSTSKFKRFTAPNLPDFSKKYKGRVAINSFSEGTIFSKDKESINLNWQFWHAKMSLDTIAFFNFLYPENKVFKSFTRLEISNGQLAPFVVENGEMLPVHIVYIDEKPVYFSMTETVQRYSFRTLVGWHNVKLRTSYKEISIDSVFVQENGKTIISIDPSFSNPHVSSLDVEPELSKHEIRLAESYLTRVSNQRNSDEAYIRQGDNIHWLRNSDGRYRNYNNSIIVGPVYSNATAKYVLRGSFEMPFEMEKNYTYEFSEKIIKMKSFERLLNSAKLAPFQRNFSLNDLAVTQEEVEEYIDLKKEAERKLTSYDFPKTTSQGYGKIALILGSELLKRVQNLVVFHDTRTQFIRVYPDHIITLHNFLSGEYTIYGLLDNDDFFEAKAIVRVDGSTYVTVLENDIKNKNTTSSNIKASLNRIFEAATYSQYNRRQDLKEVQRNYYEDKRAHFKNGNTITGHIYDAESGEPLPGVNVLVKGTTIGTISDIDGFYSIDIPTHSTELSFSFIGSVTEEVLIGYKNEVDVTMYADVKQLSEVVVVGYSAQQRRSLTSSLTTVESDKLLPGIENILSGKIAGVAITQSGTVKIRGASSVENNSNPLFVINGIPYEGNEADIDPSKIASIEVMKGNQATLIYGSRAANGVVLITTHKTSQGLQVRLVNSTSPMEGYQQAKSFRTNFKDDAFWFPSLKTNSQGLARFTATFPDDITSWRTNYLAMNGKKQSGQWQGAIQAYKPIMGVLSVPRFLLTGDSSFVIGKTLNYSEDSISATRHFKVDNVAGDEIEGLVSSSRIDSILISPINTDTLKVSYTAKTDDNYEDGELRTIPVFRKGVLESKGRFYVLSDLDTALSIPFNISDGRVNLYAKATTIDLLLDEIEHVVKYPYLCNEQAASKLLMLLSKKNIYSILNKAFKEGKNIEELIRRLEKSNNAKSLWGWWKDNETVPWISQHVIKALIEAESMGFKITIDKQKLIDELVVQLDKSKGVVKIDLVNVLKLLGAKIDYKAEIDIIDQDTSRNFTDTLRLTILKQQLDINTYSIDSILSKKKETALGNIFWGNPNSYVYDNDVQTTLLAYKVLEQEEGHEDLLDKIILFLLNKRQKGYWVNTYQSAEILSTVLPRLVKHEKDISKPSLALSGSLNMTIDKFPFESAYDFDDTLSVTKKGLGTVYFAAYQQVFNESPEKVDSDFSIRTYFEKGDNILIAGSNEKLIVNLSVKAKSEYVMLEVPIPAGCSYGEKRRSNYREAHREYFSDRVSVFFEQLSPGEYSFEIELIPRFTGSYTLNPARAELMYFPIFYGRNEMKKVSIHSR
ncbi:MAG: carboxypeptidase-like regulatory domain-containing protein [Imperialibacter sp.]|uniref:carboxypeptidase-like regulatory domain-containing protein n=1 Tax=Imperialibacter sp. TaxID=2038411 RepID=UPI0032F0780C